MILLMRLPKEIDFTGCISLFQMQRDLKNTIHSADVVTVCRGDEGELPFLVSNILYITYHISDI